MCFESGFLLQDKPLWSATHTKHRMASLHWAEILLSKENKNKNQPINILQSAAVLIWYQTNLFG